MKRLPLALAALAGCGGPPAAIPEPRIALDGPVEIPLAETELPVVAATVDGRPELRFLLDTGSSISIVDPAAARAAGIELRPYSTKGSTKGADGRVAEYDRYVRVDRLEIGGLAIEDLRLPAIETTVLGRRGWTGLLGQDVLAKLVLVLDCERARVHALPASTDIEGIRAYLQEAKLGQGKWAVTPIDYRPCPFVGFESARLPGGKLELELDTGASHTSLPAPAIEALGLEEVGTFAADGIGGLHSGRTYRLTRLGLNEIEFSTDVRESSLDYGLLGMDVLGELVVVFEAPHGRVWLHRREPAPDAGR